MLSGRRWGAERDGACEGTARDTARAAHRLPSPAGVARRKLTRCGNSSTRMPSGVARSSQAIPASSFGFRFGTFDVEMDPSRETALLGRTGLQAATRAPVGDHDGLGARGVEHANAWRAEGEIAVVEQGLQFDRDTVDEDLPSVAAAQCRGLRPRASPVTRAGLWAGRAPA